MKEKLEGRARGSHAPSVPKISGLMCHACVNSSQGQRETRSADGSSVVETDCSDLRGGCRTHSRFSRMGAAAMVAPDRVLEGPEKWPWGPWHGTKEVGFPCRYGGGGPDRLQPGQGKGKVSRWLPLCPEMPEAAAGLDAEHSCADFPVPPSLGDPSERKGWCRSPHLTPPGTGVGPVCVHMCGRRRAGAPLPIPGMGGTEGMVGGRRALL